MESFNVIGATLVEEFGGSVSFFDGFENEPMKPISELERKTHLNLNVRGAEDTRVKLSTGEQLKDMNGFVSVYPQTKDSQEERKGIGGMAYFKKVSAPPIPARYVIEVCIPLTQFEDLISAARLGRIPSIITINERGMNLLDEFSSEWDNKLFPCLNISSIWFSIPLYIGELNQENEGTILHSTSPPTQLQLFHLEKTVELLHKGMNDVNKKLRWLLVLIASLGVITLAIYFAFKIL